MGFPLPRDPEGFFVSPGCAGFQPSSASPPQEVLAREISGALSRFDGGGFDFWENKGWEWARELWVSRTSRPEKVHMFQHATAKVEVWAKELFAQCRTFMRTGALAAPSLQDFELFPGDVRNDAARPFLAAMRRAGRNVLDLAELVRSEGKLTRKAVGEAKHAAAGARASVVESRRALEAKLSEGSEEIRRTVELGTNRLARDQKNADADCVKVEAFTRFEKALHDEGGGDTPLGQIAIMQGVLGDMKEEGHDISFGARKGVEYWREWALKLGKPMTGEAYAKAKKTPGTQA